MYLKTILYSLAYRAVCIRFSMTTAYPGNMQMLINGRSVYTPLFGGVKWSDLPVALMDIERTKMTRDPNASNGANAFAATINILTAYPQKRLPIAY